jgi:hypothetical protein
MTWMKLRKEISDYPVTNQQRKVSVAGKTVRAVCTGKKGKEFVKCRTDVLQCVFGKNPAKCSIEIESAKQRVEENLKR